MQLQRLCRFLVETALEQDWEVFTKGFDQQIDWELAESQPENSSGLLFLLDRIGYQLITEAIQCLPKSFEVIARFWPTLTADQRFDALHDLSIGIKRTQARKWWPNIEGNEEVEPQPEDGYPVVHGIEEYFNWFTSIQTVEYPYEMTIPRMYGRWCEGTTKPNCLGMSIMLQAFARLSGAPALFGTLVSTLDSDHMKYEGLITEIFLGHQDGLAFREIPAEMRENLIIQKRYGLAHSGSMQDFHHCAVIKIGPQDWVMWDPYMRVCARLPADIWQVDEVASRLQVNSLYRPGDVILATDGGQYARRAADVLAALIENLDEIDDMMFNSFMVAPCLQDVTEVGPETNTDIDLMAYDAGLDQVWDLVSQPCFHFPDEDGMVDLFELLNLMDEHPYAIEYMDQRDTTGLPTRFDQILNEYFNYHMAERATRYNEYLDRTSQCPAVIAKGKDDVWEYLLTVMPSFYDDPEYRDLCLRRIWEALYVWANYTALQGLIHENGNTFAHPAIEISSPNVQIALCVANHVRCWSDSTEMTSTGTVFPRLSNAQMFWHDAMDLNWSAAPATDPDGVLAAAEAYICSLQQVHPAVVGKMRYLDQIQDTGRQ